MAGEQIILEVPIWHQPDKSNECSIAALKMLMDYCDDPVPYETLTAELKEWVNEKERHIQGAAIFLAKRGYEVWFSHHDPNIIGETIDDITETDIFKLVEAQNNVPEDDTHAVFRRRKLSLDIEYIKSGGHYSSAIPRLDLLDSRLRDRLPTIICVNLRIWESSPQNRGNHYVVVVGRDEEKYIVNDPNPNRSSPYRIDRNRLLMAWYATGAYALSGRSMKKTPSRV